ncbi:MAG TPA: hypothetical protein VFV71_08765 [Burkholderiales bacterium]|nr:hypothetical protein [Burkholderiales bacterium]
MTGPILLFIGIERGPQFAAGAAAGALAGGIAWLGFALGYAWAATRLRWWGALAAGLCAYAAVAMVVVAAAPPFAVVALLVVAGIALAPRGFPRPGPVHAQPSSPGLEIGARMAAGGVLTLAVTRLSPQLGPGLSGVLSVFPVMGIVLAAFSHRSSGSAFAILLLHGMVFGFYAFSAYCLTVALAVAQAGVAAGFALALGVSLAVHFCVLRYMRARARRAQAP